MNKRILDLDAPDNKNVVCIVAYGGVKIPITRDRLLELLANEQEWLKASTGAHIQTPVDNGKGEENPVLSPIDGPISHGSLSYRVKLIYKYSVSSKRLREAQISLLRELFTSFNWKIPRHPNTALDTQLMEMQSWKKVPAECKKEIEAFLSRYRQARQDADPV